MSDERILYHLREISRELEGTDRTLLDVIREHVGSPDDVREGALRMLDAAIPPQDPPIPTRHLRPGHYVLSIVAQTPFEGRARPQTWFRTTARILAGAAHPEDPDAHQPGDTVTFSLIQPPRSEPREPWKPDLNRFANEK